MDIYDRIELAVLNAITNEVPSLAGGEVEYLEVTVKAGDRRFTLTIEGDTDLLTYPSASALGVEHG